MAGISISGLMSGLDTNAIVGQLMSVERMAKTPIVLGQNKASALSEALTNLNGLFKKLGDAANGFAPASVLDKSNFDAVTTKSSDESVATVTPGAKPATADLSFTVRSVAQASSGVSKNAFTLTDTLGNGQALNLNIGTGGKTTDVTVNAGATLTDVVDAINTSGAGVRANLLKVNDTQYALQITAEKTGLAGTVSIDDASGTFSAGLQETAKGADTQITVGSGANALSITSSERTIKDLVPGLDVTVKKASAEPVRITSRPDNDTLAQKAQDFVNAMNSVLSDVSSKTKANANAAPSTDPYANSGGGVFLGNSTVLNLQQQLQNVLVGSAANLPSNVGISIDKNGAATFDKDAFVKALNEDPARVKTIMTETAKQVGQVTKAATDMTNGALTMAVQGQSDVVKDYTQRLSNFEDRMTSLEARYKAKFDALDSMLSKMKSQSDWLSGQLKSLPSASSN